MCVWQKGGLRLCVCADRCGCFQIFSLVEMAPAGNATSIIKNIKFICWGAAVVCLLQQFLMSKRQFSCFWIVCFPIPVYKIRTEFSSKCVFLPITWNWNSSSLKHSSYLTVFMDFLTFTPCVTCTHASNATAVPSLWIQACVQHLNNHFLWSEISFRLITDLFLPQYRLTGTHKCYIRWPQFLLPSFSCPHSGFCLFSSMQDKEFCV